MAKEVALFVLKILEEETSLEHMLSKEEILQKLYEKYDVMIEEKSFYRKIDELISAGYNIVRTKGRTTKYCLNTSRLNSDELAYLSMLILGSHDLSEKEAANIVKKLTSMPIHDSVKSVFNKYQDKFKSDNNPINFLNRLSIVERAINEYLAIECKEILSHSDEYVFSDAFKFIPQDIDVQDNEIYVNAKICHTGEEKRYLLRNLINLKICEKV